MWGRGREKWQRYLHYTEKETEERMEREKGRKGERERYRDEEREWKEKNRGRREREGDRKEKSKREGGRWKGGGKAWEGKEGGRRGQEEAGGAGKERQGEGITYLVVPNFFAHEESQQQSNYLSIVGLRYIHTGRRN